MLKRKGRLISQGQGRVMLQHEGRLKLERQGVVISVLMTSHHLVSAPSV